MSANTALLNTAHQHVANADEYLAKGLLALARTEHSKAAEAYTAAIECSHDESAKRTLRRLSVEHRKAEKELQRKIEKLVEEGKDPNLPQKPDAPQPFTPLQNPNTPSSVPPRVNTSSPRLMTDSQNTPDESFMLLGGQRSDPGDAFNQFWNIMQGMLDNLSQPVAFATVPLGEPDFPNAPSPVPKPEERRRDHSLSSDTDSDEPIFSKFTRRIGFGRDSTKVQRTGAQASPVKNTEEFDDDEFGDDLLDGKFHQPFASYDDLSGSFLVVPSGSDGTTTNLRKENMNLKADLANTKAKLEALERVIKIRKEQDVQLRDSIFLATREAQRVLGASAIHQRPPGPPLDFSALNTPVPIPGISSTRETQYLRRIKELEEEVRSARSDNEKLKAMIGQYRERWNKLKESAKKKKEAKAATTSSTPIRERIIEEPEAEEELDDSRPDR